MSSMSPRREPADGPLNRRLVGKTCKLGGERKASPKAPYRTLVDSLE